MLLPFVTRNVVHVSGAELSTVLKFKKMFVPQQVYTPRLQLALDNYPCGSLILVVNPCLAGLEDRGYAAISGDATAATATAPGAHSAQQALEALQAVAGLSSGTSPPLSAGVEIGETGLCRPRAKVPLASEGAIAPALRPHYELSADGQELVYQPSFRVCAGLDPLARAYLCLWKGQNRFNIMVADEESKALEIILEGAGLR